MPMKSLQVTLQLVMYLKEVNETCQNKHIALHRPLIQPKTIGPKSVKNVFGF